MASRLLQPCSKLGHRFYRYLYEKGAKEKAKSIESSMIHDGIWYLTIIIHMCTKNLGSKRTITQSHEEVSQMSEILKVAILEEASACKTRFQLFNLVPSPEQSPEIFDENDSNM